MQTSKSNFFESLDEIMSVQTERKNPYEKTENNFYNPEQEQEQQTQEIEEENEDESAGGGWETSGRTTAFLVSGGIETVFTVGESLLFHLGRFSSGEISRAKELLDKNAAGMELTQEEKKLLSKFTRIRDQHERIRERIPFTDDELESMAAGFTQYHKATGKKSDPRIILWVTIIRAIAGRATDIFL